VPQYDADPARAAALLNKAGWLVGPDGIRMKGGRRLSITISTPSGFHDGLQFEELFQQWMHDVGVDVVVDNYPSNLLFATFGGGGILATGKFDTAFVDWYNGIDPDDSIQWECAYFPPAGQNFSHWCDPAFDAAESLALSTYDRAARKRDYALAQQRMAAGVPADFLYFIGRTDLLSDRLVGYHQSPAVSTFWGTWEYDLK
jgi:peptide/nickel transport system substrate-binding protein